jgi:hypothetical protein
MLILVENNVGSPRPATPINYKYPLIRYYIRWSYYKLKMLVSLEIDGQNGQLTRRNEAEWPE